MQVVCIDQRGMLYFTVKCILYRQLAQPAIPVLIDSRSLAGPRAYPRHASQVMSRSENRLWRTRNKVSIDRPSSMLYVRAVHPVNRGGVGKVTSEHGAKRQKPDCRGVPALRTDHPNTTVSSVVASWWMVASTHAK
jgi:hypothetical protein